MVVRVTENMKYNTSLYSLFNVQSKYNEVLEKLSTQKQINRPSDDPLGMMEILNLRTLKNSLTQYQKNIENARGWLNLTESKLDGAKEIVNRASEIAIAQANATASADTRRVAAQTVQQLIDELFTLANAKYGDSYLFSGSRTDTVPFLHDSLPATYDEPKGSPDNVFDGTVSGGGIYTGAKNNTYVIRIVNGGTLNEATYQLSLDGGKTWGAIKDDLDGGTISLQDGLTLTFVDSGSNRLAAGDLFYLNAYAAGNYRGDDGSLYVDVGRGATVSYNISGEKAFAGRDGGVDIFQTLADLKTALNSNDQPGIAAKIDSLRAAYDQLTLYQAKVGNIVNRLDMAKSNLQDLEQNTDELLSLREDADVAQLATQLAMKEVALKASYATAAKIGANTILDFMK